MLDRIKKMPFVRRDDEPDYAKLPKVAAPAVNQYGQPIELTPATGPLAGHSLSINGADGVSDNPDRYKQHGFYFNADNCISCHACESACSEKNNLPPHLAFRSVGYVEGGTWPDYHRLNISMACNHCDDPVCLKGCPTRAYTKFAEYGAVLQDPDICFGCGYCTWVCPYNAPQLDPVHGQVEKCNMCVDRLEVGLKPACASACLAGALDFGVVDTLPDNRDQLETALPGFPSPEITHPNIRFQQKKTLPREMLRPDSMPLLYERDEAGAIGTYKTRVRSESAARQWNLGELSSRENPLVLFTLLSQAGIGAFLLTFLAPYIGVSLPVIERSPVWHQGLLFLLLAMQGIGLLLSTVHLGKPLRFYRGFNNLRYSPVSREAATLMLYFTALGAHFLSIAIPYWLNLTAGAWEAIQSASGWMAVVAGPVSLYFMQRIYRIKARPFWNHWQVLTSFYGTMFALGAWILLGASFVASIFAGLEIGSATRWLLVPMVLGLALEGIGLLAHARYLDRIGGEAAASHFQQCSRFGKTYLFRNILLGLSLASLALVYATGVMFPGVYLVTGLSILMMLGSAVIGRALFYVLVIPTTMPGAFFWKNRGFQDHARKTGLADLPQVGVVPDGH